MYCLTLLRNFQTQLHEPPSQKLKDALFSGTSRVELWRLVTHFSKQYIDQF